MTGTDTMPLFETEREKTAVLCSGSKTISLTYGLEINARSMMFGVTVVRLYLSHYSHNNGYEVESRG